MSNIYLYDLLTIPETLKILGFKFQASLIGRENYRVSQVFSLRRINFYDMAGYLAKDVEPLALLMSLWKTGIMAKIRLVDGRVAQLNMIRGLSVAEKESYYHDALKIMEKKAIDFDNFAFFQETVSGKKIKDTIYPYVAVATEEKSGELTPLVSKKTGKEWSIFDDGYQNIASMCHVTKAARPSIYRWSDYNGGFLKSTTFNGSRLWLPLSNLDMKQIGWKIRA